MSLACFSVDGVRDETAVEGADGHHGRARMALQMLGHSLAGKRYLLIEGCLVNEEI
jgi:hypothetical protein